MKAGFLVAFIFLLVCVSIEGIKHEKRAHKYTSTKDGVAKKITSSTDKTKEPATGHFSLKTPKNPKHLKQIKTVQYHTRKSKRKASSLLKQFKRCLLIYGAKHCKKRNNFKKAMIWPKKMLPALEKMLMKKLNGGQDTGYDNYEPPSVDKNDFADNWDNLKHPDPPHPNMFNGMEVVPLVKMLKEKVSDSSSLDTSGFNGMPTNFGGSKYTKMLLSQALGKPDRGTVMKDMMQEFYLASNNNNNERVGQEAREAFSELMGHNSLVKANSDIMGGNSDYNRGMLPDGSNTQIGRMNMPERIQNFAPQESEGGDATGGVQRFQGFGGGGGTGGGMAFGGGGGAVVQAQELPNGKIAPVNQPLDGPSMQQMIPMNANPTTRMLGSVKVSTEPLVGDQVMENQMPEAVAAMHDSNSRPLFMQRNNDLIFDEEGGNAARGFKQASFEGGNPYFAQKAMNIGANYQSSPVTEPNLSAANGGFEIQGNKLASFAPIPQEFVPSRRDNFPAKHKSHKSDVKTAMRSKSLSTSSNDKVFKKGKTRLMLK